MIAGWWCSAQAALHSVLYLNFYRYIGGWRGLWENCFPVPLADVSPDAPPQDAKFARAGNTEGFVNGMGVLAFVVLLALALPALPSLRRRYYHVFQLLHLPLSILWIVCSILHDLPILLFALPGLADWFLCWRAGMRRCSATARLLSATSGPWVELTIRCASLAPVAEAPRGQWVSVCTLSKVVSIMPLHSECTRALTFEKFCQVRVLPLGREAHPLSVAALSTTNNSTTLILVVSTRAGDWSRGIATLAQQQVNSFEVDLGGPFAHGGSWSLSGSGRPEASLLLLAGGTGITGWLPALATAAATDRKCHLVWCVQRKADYQALARWLPPGGIIKVTVFVTQASAAATCGGSAGSIEMLPNASSPTLVDDGVDQPLEQSPSMLRASQIQVTDTSATMTVTEPTQDSAGSLASVSLAATLTGLVVGWLLRLRGRGVGGQAEGQGMNYLEEQHGPYRSLVDYVLLNPKP